MDVAIAKLMEGEILSEPQVRVLTERARQVLMEESNAVLVPAPVTIVGDIHGQWHDLVEIFSKLSPTSQHYDILYAVITSAEVISFVEQSLDQIDEIRQKKVKKK